jgi:hypothetical protein
MTDRQNPPQLATNSDKHGLLNWPRQWWNSVSTRRRQRAFQYAIYVETQHRSVQLLKENLSESQREQYAKRGYFEVIGGQSGKRYRIRRGHQMNVEQLDKNGKRVLLLCFMPDGCLATEDTMLAQKVALELFESDAIKVAHKMPIQFCRLGPIA